MPSLNTETTHNALDRLLRPRSIAVIGASSSGLSGGNQAIRNLRAAGYSGSIEVVHPRGGRIEDVNARRAVADLPSDVDVALVNVPASGLLEVLRALDARGVAGAIVGTAGLSASTAGEMAEFAETATLKINGPNCMGILAVADDCPMWFYEGLLTDLPKGHAALVTQSGSAAFLARAAEGVGFSHIISSGNECGVTTAEYLEWLAEDPQTKVIGVVMESLTDVAAFENAIRKCREHHTPVVVLKVGRTAEGAAASVAHTGAIVGSHEAYQALFRRLDVPLVNDYDELSVALSYLGSDAGRPAAGRRVAVVTDSGGEAALSADLASGGPVAFPAFTEGTLAKLRELLPGMEPRNPLDVGGSPTADEDVYAQVLPIVVADENIDSIMMVVEAMAAMSSDEIGYAESMYQAARAASEDPANKPVVITSPTSVSVSASVQELIGSRSIILRGLGNAIHTMDVAAGNQRPVVASPSRPADLPSAPEVDWLLLQLASHHGPVPLELSKRILSAYRVPFVESSVVANAEDALHWAEGRYPVVVKVESADVPHRSDVGGVITNVTNSDELILACKHIENNVAEHVPGAVITGFEVQDQVGEADEVLAGITLDPALGPVITVGIGGVLVELVQDVQVGLAPLREGEAAEMIAGTKLSTILAGYRRASGATDTTELIAVLERLSWLAHDLASVLAEADFNPVMVERGTGQVRVVDALLVTRPTAITAS